MRIESVPVEPARISGCSAFATSFVDLSRSSCARIVYQSGHVEEFLIVVSATNAFDNMREQFLAVAQGAPISTGVHALADGATVAVRWTGVALFYTWQD